MIATFATATLKARFDAQRADETDKFYSAQNRKVFLCCGSGTKIKDAMFENFLFWSPYRVKVLGGTYFYIMIIRLRVGETLSTRTCSVFLHDLFLTVK